MIYQSEGSPRASVEQAGWLAWMAKYRDQYTYSKYGDVGTYDACYAINTTRGRGDPPVMYLPCFSDRLMAHQFPTGFKLINIERYDGSTDLAVWIEVYILVVHVSNGNDIHAIKYLPVS